MHGVAFKTSVPLPPALHLQVEIPDSQRHQSCLPNNTGRKEPLNTPKLSEINSKIKMALAITKTVVVVVSL